tara:strand:- start:282 stop:878 length:597 start_codon:yes stop_codon:yes gene_type:complete
MKRYEIKFDISEFKINKIVKDYRLKKLHPERTVKSIYFDTINYNYFIESEEGQTPRKKIRIRSYNNKKIYSLEFKFTNAHHRKKIVINNFIYNYKNILNQLLKLNINDLIHPKLLVTYNRLYFSSSIGRVTIDKNINYQKVNSNLKTSSGVITDHKTILEVKINEKNFDKYKVMKFFNFQESRNSKYCNGINLFKNLN